MPRHTPATSCKDCGTTEGLDWWTHHGDASGMQRCRCQSCFNIIQRDRQRVYAARRRAVTPTPTCGDCGGPNTSYHHSQKRCKACSLEHAKTYRTASEARRRVAYLAGDRDIHWLPLGERDGWVCHICTKRVPRKAGTAHVMDGATVDHLVPISDDGEHVWHNVALAHRSCNISRRAGGLAQLRLAVA